MITAQGASVGVGLEALFGGALEIKTVRLEAPVVHLERAKDGRVNWTFRTEGAPEPAAEGSGAAARSPVTEVSLELGEITDGRVHFVDRQAGTVVDLRAITGTVSLEKGAAGAARCIAHNDPLSL